MLAQLKTVVLIKEAIKLAFFRLVEYLEHQHLWVWLQAQNGQKQRLSSETRQSILVLRNEGYSMRAIAKKLKISYRAVYYSRHRTAQTVSNQNRKRSGRPRCTTEQEDKYIRVSSLRSRRLTSPQLAASLTSTGKTPVSTSTVKKQPWDAGHLGRVPLSSVCVLLPILIFSFYLPISGSRLITVDVETGVLRVLFNEAASSGLVRRLFLKLDTLMYLSSCSVVHRGLSLLFLFWLETVYAVLWRE